MQITHLFVRGMHKGKLDVNAGLRFLFVRTKWVQFWLEHNFNTLKHLVPTYYLSLTKVRYFETIVCCKRNWSEIIIVFECIRSNFSDMLNTVQINRSMTVDEWFIISFGKRHPSHALWSMFAVDRCLVVKDTYGADSRHLTI